AVGADRRQAGDRADTAAHRRRQPRLPHDRGPHERRGAAEGQLLHRLLYRRIPHACPAPDGQARLRALGPRGEASAGRRGLELEGEAPVEGRWVDRVVGLNDVRADIAMMRTPDGHSRVELTKFHTPPAVRAEPESAPANTLGIRRIMFAVDDIDDVVARLRS